MSFSGVSGKMSSELVKFVSKKKESKAVEKPIQNESAGFRENVQEYLLNSTLHGLRYIGTKTISTFERVFFALAFVLVTILATYFITNIYQKWNDSPIIIGLNPVAVEGKIQNLFEKYLGGNMKMLR